MLALVDGLHRGHTLTAIARAQGVSLSRLSRMAAKLGWKVPTGQAAARGTQKPQIAP